MTDKLPPVPESSLNRRSLLRTIGGGVVTTGIASTSALGQEGEASVRIDDQESDGYSVVLAAAQTSVSGRIAVRSRELDRQLWSEPVSPGYSFEAKEIQFNEPVTETGTIQLAVSIYNEDGQGIARSTADIQFTGEAEFEPGISPTMIEADPAAGFNYPYFLYAPNRTASKSERPVLVEPANSGQSTDEMEPQIRAGERLVTGGITRDVASSLGAPLVVPVFKRPRTNPVDYTHYTHALDNTTMELEQSDLERIDLQVLRMVEDAQNRLEQRGYSVSTDGIVLNGFSASGNFVERFAALHPDEVISVTAGGINGMPILPIEEANGHTLDYHIGVANIEELTGDPFDLDAFRDVNQFLYLGSDDSNDTVPYDDAFTGDLDAVAVDVYGDDMQEERLPYSKAVYDEVEAGAVFRMYDGVGHTPRPAKEDVIEFHERSLDGESAADLRGELGGGVPNLRAYIEFEPQSAKRGEQVAFDATKSSVADDEIVEYEWEFNGGTVKEGELVTHAFTNAGGQNVKLTVTTESGASYESTTQVVVSEQAVSRADCNCVDTNRSESRNTSNASPTDSMAGFGVASAATAVAGVGVALKWWASDRR